MATYTASPGSSTSVEWDDATIWGGVVPNAPDADVVLPALPAGSSPNYYSVDTCFGKTYAIRSLSAIGGGLEVGGTLGVSGMANIQSDELYLFEASLSAGSLQLGVAAFVYGGGTITAGSLTNAGTITLSGITATVGTLQNTGTIESVGVGKGTLVVTGAAANGTLSGGTYESAQAGTLQLKGLGAITTDATTIDLGLPGLGSAATNEILTFDPASGTYRPLESTLATVAAGGTLDLSADTYAGTTALTVAGTLTVGEGSVFSAPSLTVLAGGQVAGIGSITAPVVNNGVLGVASDPVLTSAAAPTSLVVNGAVTGSGTLQVGVGGIGFASVTTPLTLELNGATGEGVAFQGAVGTLQLDHPATFTGSISGFTGKDSVVLAGVPSAAVTGYSYAGTTSGGVLTVNEGASSISLAFTGSYTTASFALAAGSQASTLAITDTGVTGSATTGGGSTGGGSTIVLGGFASSFGSGPLVGIVDGTNGDSVTGPLAAIGAGGPGYLQWQFISAGSDNLAVSTQGANVLLASGSGNDALQVTSGQNVLDGGTGSNFLTGGTGTDTFFTDARSAAVVWNTLQNFHAGDAATLWGFTAGVSSYTWDPTPAGAPGAQGATLRANIVGGAGRTGNGIDASITFAGLSVAQAQKLQVVTGTQAAGSYLYLYNPGV